MAFIQVIDHPQSSGELRAIYDHVVATRGKLADVHTIQSLNPPTVLSHMNLYKDIMFGPSPLKRYQREMLAVVVSSVNQCVYCQRHHREALKSYWKNDAKIEQLVSLSFREAGLSEEDQALCQLARDVTENPELTTRQRIDSLRCMGPDDRAILDAVLVISYFNFVNRIVLTLGLDINEAEISGYRY